MTERLNDKIALVTGAGSGLGAAIATRFASEGARVLVTDIDTDAARAVSDRIGDRALSHRLDVTDIAQWAAAVEAVEQAFGGLHVLVNNAGVCLAGSVESLSLEDWRSTHNIDLDSVFFGVRAALPLQRRTVGESGRGSILNISSISAMVAGPNLAAYNSAKAAVRHLTKSIALHCARAGDRITCNSLHPTFIDTPLLDGFSGPRTRAETHAKLASQIPLGRLGVPNDVAWAAVYLCSNEASFVTGSELCIDGGISAG